MSDIEEIKRVDEEDWEFLKEWELAIERPRQLRKRPEEKYDKKGNVADKKTEKVDK